ncbi:transcription elongation factor GreA [Raineyella sp.]|uniref:Transcription elongation factor GreA n=1 Tax=bioreactor metagenome TaxID=1076179 RepID=A0A644YRB8_9ZZZZ|nr:transcription elongation factor GreA [Raineyella sp.]MEA5154390.1 transcription elongation factor GreA [Raineyella sp.]
MAENVTDTVFLTQAAHDRLIADLEALKGNREAISRKIAQAREEGDLSENAGYHAAREEQGQQEAKITEIEHILRTAQVGEGPADTDVVGVGTVVTVAWDGDEDDSESFFLGSRENALLDASLAETDVYSPQSPIGQAVLGARIGQAVEFDTPTGATASVTILNIEAH